ncbi:MAG: dihydrolipoyl dehydrogenase [Clostridiales bacterium]|nr:dihydrolipoyl dehydrogenase [Clostridiales bacterium]
MAKLLIMPKLSIVMKGGTIINWYFKEGDTIKKGDILYDVEAEKMGGSAESEEEGTLLKILVNVGEKAVCGDPVAIIGEAGENFDDLIPKKEEAAEEETKKTSVAVIGGGPGGYVAAIRAAQLGADVTLIEKSHIGGTCLNEGCIPTKALLHSAEVFSESKNGAEIGVIAKPSLDFAKVMENKNKVVGRLVGGVQALLKSNGVKVISGEGCFVDKETVIAKTADGETEIKADKYIIAAGSLSSSVPIEGADGLQCIDSTGALSLESLPESMVIIGGGVIGVEMATAYSAFGTKVTIVEMLPRLLMNMDEEMVNIALKSLTDDNADIMTSAKVMSIENKGAKAVVKVDKDGTVSEIEAEKVLLCIGRKPNTAPLKLENAGIDTERGAIKVNDHMETNVKNIYAIGDCIGGTMLAHIASAQGEVAAENAMGQDSRYDEKTNPACVYTQPEMATVGYTEERANKEGISYITGVFGLGGNGKSIIMNGGEGFVKILAHKRSKKILGMQIIGPRATDLIIEGALAISMNAGIEDIIKTIHAHPTVSEAVREAALAADNRAIHG